MNESDQQDIEDFMYNKVSVENTDVVILISKLFHNESEKIRLEKEIDEIKNLMV